MRKLLTYFLLVVLTGLSYAAEGSTKAPPSLDDFWRHWVYYGFDDQPGRVTHYCKAFASRSNPGIIKEMVKDVEKYPAQAEYRAMVYSVVIAYLDPKLSRIVLNSIKNQGTPDEIKIVDSLLVDLEEAPSATLRPPVAFSY